MFSFDNSLVLEIADGLCICYTPASFTDMLRAKNIDAFM